MVVTLETFFLVWSHGWSGVRPSSSLLVRAGVSVEAQAQQGGPLRQQTYPAAKRNLSGVAETIIEVDALFEGTNFCRGGCSDDERLVMAAKAARCNARYNTAQHIRGLHTLLEWAVAHLQALPVRSILLRTR